MRNSYGNLMKHFVFCALAATILFSCEKEVKPTMNVTGTVKGLKKGTLYLQKIEDTLLVTLDSIEVKGDPQFQFSTEIESPEMYYLYLNKKDGNEINDRIGFFGEEGTIIIDTEVDFFEKAAKIEGSETHKKLEEYKKMMARFNARHLELLQAHFEARKDSNITEIDSIIGLSDRNLMRGYLYSLNFALTNSKSHVAPYIALSEVFDAKFKYLDTIYKSLSPEVASSKYGKKLGEYIKEIKTEEPRDSLVN